MTTWMGAKIVIAEDAADAPSDFALLFPTPGLTMRQCAIDAMKRYHTRYKRKPKYLVMTIDEYADLEQETFARGMP